MKFKRAPVADLLAYAEGLYDNKKILYRVPNVLQLISNYYSKLTKHESIMPVGDLVLEDWCEFNYSNVMKNCPNIPGLIVYRDNYKGEREWGLLYHSGYICGPDRQTNFLSFLSINDEGRVTSHTYHWSEWDGWGAPVRYFYFPEDVYVESYTWRLGERPLELHTFGHDVKMLQTMLYKAHPEISLTGYFDEATEKALKETQTWANQEANGVFDLENGGQKIVDFLAGGRKPSLR